MTAADTSPAVSEAERAGGCVNVLAHWNYYGRQRLLRPQRITRTSLCGRTASTTVRTVCGSCDHRSAGPWCGKCISDNVHEYRHNRLWCHQCGEWGVALTID